MPKNAKEIPDFLGYYVTPGGSVWSGPRRYSPGYRKLKPPSDGRGYLVVHLRNDKKRKTFTRKIHRLVLETFVGSAPAGMECCHKNDIKIDNRLENLRWDTRSNNAKDAYHNGRQDYCGEKGRNAKLNLKQVHVIRHLLKFPKEFTQAEIGRMFGVTCRAISSINNNHNWKGL